MCSFGVGVYQFSPNLPAPINVGSTAQTKTGNLIIEGSLTTGSFTMLAGAGADKVLTTDASGVASWQTATAGATPGGSTGYVQFASSTSFAGDSNLFWDNTNKRFGIATTTPAYTLDVIGTLRTTATTTFSGNVGIGTTEPSKKLEVVGDINVTGDITATGFTDAGFNDIFLGDRFIEIIDLKSSLDGFTVSLGTGGYANPTGMYFEQGFTLNGTYSRTRSNGALQSQNIYGKTTTFDFFLLYTSNPSDSNTYIYFTNDITQPPSETAKHFGFKCVAGRIYASSADGTSQTLTDTGVNIGNPTYNYRLRIEWASRNELRFYHNGNLVATHPTVLPVSRWYEGYYLSMGLERNTLPGYYKEHWGRILITNSY